MGCSRCMRLAPLCRVMMDEISERIIALFSSPLFWAWLPCVRSKPSLAFRSASSSPLCRVGWRNCAVRRMVGGIAWYQRGRWVIRIFSKYWRRIRTRLTRASLGSSSTPGRPFSDEPPLRAELFSTDQMEQHGVRLASAHRVTSGRCETGCCRGWPRTKAC